jgi:MFS transporter, DHA3 family, macrolide efflux protein
LYSFLKEHKNFRNFWFGQVVSQIGDRIHTLAVIWLVYSWTKSGTALGVVLIAATLPSVLISPWAGAVSDRLNRKHIAIACDIIRCVLVFVLAGMAHYNLLNMPVITVMTALISIASSFFNPATLAMLPSIIASKDLARGNAITQLSANASGALGFLLGSGLIAAIGVPAAFLFNGCSFFASALLIRNINYQHTPNLKALSFVADLKDGWNVVQSIPMVARILGPLVVINFLFSSLSVLIPIFGEGVFKSGSAGVGVLLASYTCGMFLAALALSTLQLKANMSWLVTSSLVVVGASFLAMGLVERLPLFVVALVLVGFALNGTNICLITMFQRVIPGETRGKFFSLLTAVSLSAQPIAFGVTGWLSDLVNPAAILLVCGVALLLCAGLIYRITELREQYV